MEQKKCGHCNVGKSIDNFYVTRSKGKMTFSSWCKQCYKDNENTPKKRLVRQKYYSSEAGKEKFRKYKSSEKGKTMLNNEHTITRKKANSAVKYAIKKGRMPRPDGMACRDCGKQANLYHHWSYEKENWLNVIPMCTLCHQSLHGTKKKVWVV